MDILNFFLHVSVAVQWITVQETFFEILHDAYVMGGVRGPVSVDSGSVGVYYFVLQGTCLLMMLALSLGRVLKNTFFVGIHHWVAEKS